METSGQVDRLFNVEVLSCTKNPETLVYQALHQCYSSNPVSASTGKLPSETECGAIIVKRLLAGGKGHYSPLEMASMVLSCQYLNHALVQQIRTHRVGVSFSVQSFRYTSQSILNAAAGNNLDVEKAFYLRPIGDYNDREGNKYIYTQEQRDCDLKHCHNTAIRYRTNVESGMPEEQARGMINFDVRQHMVMGVNARSLMHLLDVRGIQNAQLEIQWFSSLLFRAFSDWCPEVSKWYLDNRMGKSKLAP